MKKRNINIDLVKVVAVFSVISIHFFLNNGFYSLTIDKNMYAMVFFRNVFAVCVPLFLITTGYLMRKKELSKKYYFGIFRVLIIYFFYAIIFYLYKFFYLNETIVIKEIIKGIFAFDVDYSWYVNMYIGLFLIIPFLNIIYNNLKCKKHKKLLILTMLILTSFSGIFNFKYRLIPDWWVNIYPITYYFIGCYFNEFDLKISKKVNVILLLLSFVLTFFVNFYISNGTTFVRGVHNDWSSILNVCNSCFVFLLLLNLKLENIPILMKKIIISISDLSFGIYLTSAIVDDMLYFHYFKDSLVCNYVGYFKIVPLVFVLSIGLSMIINVFYKLINAYVLKKIKIH